MGTFWSQLRPGTPQFTEADLPDLAGKVFLVTGGSSGVGLEISKLLYSKNAKVYIASRTESTASAAIQALTTSVTSSGELKFLPLDLGNLEKIRDSAAAFAKQEAKLDALWNNAGVGVGPPPGSLTAQGLEIRLGTNCVGPFLFTQLLLPQLRAAARDTAAGSTRILWTSSIFVETAPKGGIVADELSHAPADNGRNYTNSKVGNWFLASEFAHRLGKEGIVSLTYNPGNLRTNIWDGASRLFQKIISPFLFEPKFGAYTALWAGLSSGISISEGGRYGIPWGRWHPKPRADLVLALKPKEEGGTGQAREFWEYCHHHTEGFLPEGAVV